MFAFDVSLCEISTFGANGEMQHSPPPPPPGPQQKCAYQYAVSQTCCRFKTHKMLKQFKNNANVSKLGF